VKGKAAQAARPNGLQWVDGGLAGVFLDTGVLVSAKIAIVVA
jgi:hypothetical protein